MNTNTGFPVKNNGRTIEKAIKLCGSQAELARKLEETSGVTCYSQKINEWRTRGIIPPYWVRHMATVTSIPRSEIDPALYA